MRTFIWEQLLQHPSPDADNVTLGCRTPWSFLLPVHTLTAQDPTKPTAYMFCPGMTQWPFSNLMPATQDCAVHLACTLQAPPCRML